jgi:hypothetical protein
LCVPSIGVDHPDCGRLRIARTALFAEETVLRKQPGQPGDDEVFAAAIGIAHQVLHSLAVDAQKLATGEMVGGDPARFANDGLGRPQAVVEIGWLQRTPIHCY